LKIEIKITLDSEEDEEIIEKILKILEKIDD